MPFDLGAAPQGFTVRLTTGSRFRAVIESQDGDWPDGTAATLVLGANLTLPATVTGRDISWDVAAAVVDAVPDGVPARLLYDGDVVWALGTVARRG